MWRVFLGPGLLGSFLLLFWMWALLDVILTDSLLIRNMQKGTWIFLVIFLPTMGAVAWLLFGRPERASMAPGGQISYQSNPHRSTSRYDTAPAGPEDSARWSSGRTSPSRPSQIEDGESLAVRQRRLMEKEAELARREAELQQREGRPDDDTPAGDTE